MIKLNTNLFANGESSKRSCGLCPTEMPWSPVAIEGAERTQRSWLGGFP